MHILPDGSRKKSKQFNLSTNSPLRYSSCLLARAQQSSSWHRYDNIGHYAANGTILMMLNEIILSFLLSSLVLSTLFGQNNTGISLFFSTPPPADQDKTKNNYSPVPTPYRYPGIRQEQDKLTSANRYSALIRILNHTNSLPLLSPWCQCSILKRKEKQ